MPQSTPKPRIFAQKFWKLWESRLSLTQRSPKSQNHPSPPLYSLTPEIFVIIAEELQIQDIYHLILTSRRLFTLFLPSLNSHAIAPKSSIPNLHWAAWHGNISLLNILFKQPNFSINLQDPVHLNWTPLYWSVRNLHPTKTEATVRLLLQLGANPSSRDRLQSTVLHRAVEGGSLAAVSLLLDHGADVNAQDDLGRTPLHCAIKPLTFWELQTLRDGATTPANAGRYPLRTDELANLLVDNRTLLNDPITRYLTWLAPKLPDRRAILALLLRSGADISITDSKGSTAVYMAVAAGDMKFTKVLLARGADPNVANQWGFNAISFLRADIGILEGVKRTKDDECIIKKRWELLRLLEKHRATRPLRD